MAAGRYQVAELPHLDAVDGSGRRVIGPGPVLVLLDVPRPVDGQRAVRVPALDLARAAQRDDVVLTAVVVALEQDRVGVDLGRHRAAVEPVPAGRRDLAR